MNILLIAHNNDLRKTITDLLSAQQEFEVQACTPDELSSKIGYWEKLCIDLLIVNLVSYPQKPTETIKQLRNLELSRLILALHLYTSEYLITPLLEAGADGYLPITTTGDEILTAIEAVSNGISYPVL